MASNSMLLACTILALLSSARAGIITMNWGRTSFQRLVPSMVVDLLLQNNITSARVYTAQDDILKAFAGSGIQLSVGIFKFYIIDSQDAARKWVQQRNPYFTSANMRYIMIGNSFFKYYLNNTSMLNAGINAMGYLQDAINEVGYGNQIKAALTMSEEVLKPNWTKPSEAEFRDEIRDVVHRTFTILKTNKTPLFIDIFPISFAWDHGFDPEFAFVDDRTNQVVTDVNGLVYTNAIAFLYDSYLWAMRKMNVTGIEISIGHVGWPTDGYLGANATTAERFYKDFLPWVKSNKGTPLHPTSIDVNINSLTDENKMPYEYPFARHWGIYTSYGDPKYKIDLSGQGRDIYPTKAKGVMRMPERWCVFTGNTTDSLMVRKNFDDACDQSDCTSLAAGGSCSQLTFAQNVSYAFNMYFQSKFQDEKACNFGGLGKVITDNPSVDRCIFPVEVVKGQQDQGILSDGNSLHDHMPQSFKILLLFFWALVWN